MALLTRSHRRTSRIAPILIAIAFAAAARTGWAEPADAGAADAQQPDGSAGVPDGGDAAAAVPVAGAAVDFGGTPPLPPRSSDIAETGRPTPASEADVGIDGRPPAPPTAREGLAWIPRLILLPAHLVTEYAVRKPIVAFARWGDEHGLWMRIYDTFTWDQRRAGIYPVFGIDLAQNQTGGAAMFWHELGVRENSFSGSASFGTGVIMAGARDRLEIFRDRSGTLLAHAEYNQRPDGVFYGLGPDTRTEEKTAYSFRVGGAGAGIDGKLGRNSHILIAVDYRDAAFAGSYSWDQTPSIDQRYGGVAQPALPPGFSGYQLVQPSATLLLDSRSPHPELASGTGVRFESRAAYATDPGDRATQFVSAAARAGAFYDFTSAHHVLSIDAGAALVEETRTRAVPFWEQPALGGTETMRGFLAGRLRGPSTLTAALRYRYPCWTFLDAELFSEVGNAFAPRFEGFAPQRLFLSYGFALRSNIAPQTPFGLTLAFASNRLDSAAFRLRDATHFAFGVSHGF